MASQIDELVRMRDVESLYELMTEDDEWINQLDAAAGLVKLGDRRGYEFLLSTTLSDDEEILEVAQEIMDSPEFVRMRSEIEAERIRQRCSRYPHKAVCGIRCSAEITQRDEAVVSMRDP